MNLSECLSAHAMLQQLFRDLNKKFVILYLDDIIVYSKTLDEHKLHLEKVFKRLKDAKIILRKKKCKFVQQELEILGNLITKDGIKPSSEKIDAIQNFKKPETLRQPRFSLGMANYSRGFVPKLAEMKLTCWNF